MKEVVDILIIEDSPSDAEMIIRALGKTNLAQNIVHLEDGAEAINFIFAQGPFSEKGDKIPKVILMDLNMPKINGIDVLQKIRSDSRTKRIPVVVLTSSKEDSDLKRCYELGVNSYIVKPVEFEEFTQTIMALGHYWLQLNEILE